MQAAAMPQEPRAAAGSSIFVGNSLQTSAYVTLLLQKLLQATGYL